MARELKPTKFGRQPAKWMVAQREVTMSRAAEILGVKRTHLRNALDGRIAPSQILIERLGEFLDVPAAELFTDAARESCESQSPLAK